VIVDPREIGPERMYKILIGSVLPRPIAWVSTLSAAKKTNLAPFSFFTVASSNPPILCFSPGYKSAIIDGREEAVPKDTLRNIRETKEFVVNIVSEFLADKMNQTSGDYGPDVSEFEAAGLTAAPCKVVAPFRVGESLINMECKLHQFVEFGHHPGAGTLVLGEVVCVHIDDSVLHNGRIDPDVLQPIGRLGGNFYTTVKDRFEIVRPKV